MSPKPFSALACAAILAGLAACAAPAGLERGGAENWVAAWATSQQIPEPRNALPDEALDDATLRQTIRVSQGGPALRLRVSNAFGTAPLRVGAVGVARAEAAGDPRIRPGASRAVTFSGRGAAIIPPGAELLSDPVPMPVAPFDDLAVSIYFPEAPARQTGHPGSRTTSFVAEGNVVDAETLDDPLSVDHWYQLSGLEVLAPAGAEAVAVMGDSITDGRGSTTNRNNRWTDFLARRLQADPRTRHVSVLNAGIGGNRVLDDGLGPNALARLDRDVLAPAGVTHLIVLEGVNDLGGAGPDAEAVAGRLIAAYEQIVRRAHARGVRVYGGTILPYGSTQVYPVTAESEAARTRINEWIRTSGAFDAVIDFDAALRDPQRPAALRLEYDSGDGLHPSPAGFEAMAGAVPLTLLSR